MVVGTPGGPHDHEFRAAVARECGGFQDERAGCSQRAAHSTISGIRTKSSSSPGFSPDTIALLKARGHEIEFKASNNDMMMILSDGDWLQAGVDPRREGKAAGF